MSVVLEVKAVTKSYGSHEALHDISFSLDSSEVVVVVGENGAGKSTLLSILAAGAAPDSGDVILHNNGKAESIVKRPSFAATRIAYVPQSIMLHTNLSVSDNLKFWAAASRIDSKSRRAEAERIIGLMKLEPYLKQSVRKLSLGLQRRVNIAASLFGKPVLLLLDEPSSGIDYNSRMDFLSFISDLRLTGVAVVYVTHIEDEINALGGKLLCLQEGKQIFFGDGKERRGMDGVSAHGVL